LAILVGTSGFDLSLARLDSVEDRLHDAVALTAAEGEEPFGFFTEARGDSLAK